jgi:hypothetical protein
MRGAYGAPLLSSIIHVQCDSGRRWHRQYTLTARTLHVDAGRDHANSAGLQWYVARVAAHFFFTFLPFPFLHTGDGILFNEIIFVRWVFPTAYVHRGSRTKPIVLHWIIT